MLEVINFLILFPILFFIPALCRYIGKIYPCNWAMLISSISLRNFLLKKKSKNNISKSNVLKFNSLKKSFLLYSFFFALIFSTVSSIILSKVSLYITDYNILIYIIFNVIYSLFILMAEIDKRYYIIPDIFSYPFILFSMLFISMISMFGEINFISKVFASSIIDSSIGGIYGYAIGIIISAIFYKKYGDAFGNGDIKLLGAIGVLVGFDKLYQVVLLSVLVFFTSSKILREKYLPYATVLFISFLIYSLSGFIL